MSASTAPEKNLLARMVADPWRKLAAVVLATGLWFFLDARVTDQRRLVCTLRIEDVAASDARAPALEGHTIDIVIPKRSYSLVALMNPLRGDEQIRQVVLEFEGPKELIRRIRTNERFVVEPTPTQLGAEPIVFEFGRADIRSRNEEFEAAIKRMIPERVKVNLVRNDQRSRRLTPGMLQLSAPPDDKLGERLDRAHATFAPETVVIRGTQPALSELDDMLRQRLEDPDENRGEALFDLDLGPYDKVVSQIRAPITLRQRWVDLGIVVEPGAVNVTIPVRPDYQRYNLKVPVVLDLTQTNLKADDFEPIEEHEVALSVTGALFDELSPKTEAERDAWAKANLRLLAPVDPRATLERVPPIVPRLVFLKTERRQGVDYKAEIMGITVTPKKKNKKKN